MSQRVKKKRSKKKNDSSTTLNLQQYVFSASDNGNVILTNNLRKYNEDDTWGDPVCQKEDYVFRIILKQIGGLGVTAGNAKEKELKEWLASIQAD